VSHTPNGGRPASPSIGYVHLGAFSGSAISLREALAERTPLATLDLRSVSREPRMLAARVAASSEALVSPGRFHRAKTAAWSKALESRYERTSKLRHRPTIFVQSMLAFSRIKVPYVVYTDRVALEGRAQSERFLPEISQRWLRRERTFLARAEKVCVMGPTTVPFLVDQYGLSPERVEVVGTGPSAHPIEPVLSNRARRLLFIGTQWELKGGPDLLEAFARVRGDFDDLQLRLVGSGPTGPPPPGVVALGRVPRERMPELLEWAHIVVMPTYVEALGNALLEAMLSGIPCVGTDIGNQPEVIGDAGEMVTPGKPEQLAAALKRIISDYPRYKELALRRRSHLRETFDWDHVANALLAALRTPPDRSGPER